MEENDDQVGFQALQIQLWVESQVSISKQYEYIQLNREAWILNERLLVFANFQDAFDVMYGVAYHEKGE